MEQIELTASARLVIRSSDPNLEGAFGRGCAMLLDGVEVHKSLNKSAKAIGMAYSKAWRLIKEAEAQLGFDLLVRDGARGSELTEKGRALLLTYRRLEDEVQELLDRRLPELFVERS